MHLKFGKTFRLVLLLIVGAALGIGCLLTYQHFKAPAQTVSVVGTGEVDAVTDQVTISVQITNKKDSQTLKDALLKLGIPQSRISESSYNGPIFQTETVPSANTTMYPRPIPSPVPTINFTITLDSIKDIEKVYTTINANPNTQITNAYYSLNNTKSWENKAKEAALKDARSQVEAVAAVNHLKVGRLISITDVNATSPLIQPMMLKGEAATNGSARQTQSDNVYYSEQTVKITASYNASYELY